MRFTSLITRKNERQFFPFLRENLRFAGRCGALIEAVAAPASTGNGDLHTAVKPLPPT
jgi:hypothetical protein